MPFPDESLDVVISEDVLEHIENFMEAYAEIKRVLRPGGVHIFTVPIREDGHSMFRKELPPIYHDAPTGTGEALLYNDFSFDLCQMFSDKEMETSYKECHQFYQSEHVSRLEEEYEAYLAQKDDPLTFFRYNSGVFVTRKKNLMERKRAEPMEFTGERFIPGQTDPELQMEHFNRYQFARQFVENKRVLDAACGAGYGTDMLARDAAFVAGIDISEESIAYAKEQYNGKRAQFQVASVDNLPFEENSFDVVVSFETLEHVDGRTQQGFLREISRVLTEDGILIMSTPNHSVYSRRGINEFHVKELDYLEFKDMLEAQYRYVCFWGQQFEICNVIAGSESGNAWMEGQIAGQRAEYLIAVCSNQPIEGTNARVIMQKENKLAQLSEWAQQNHRANEKNNIRIKQLNAQLESLYAEQEKNAAASADREKELKDKIAAQSSELAQLRQEITAQEKLENEIATQNQELTELRQETINQKGHIEQLLEPERELERIKASRSWRFMGYAWKVRDMLVPKGSRRRLFGKLAIKFIKHPIRFLSKLTPKRIGKFFKYIQLEGVDRVSGRLDDCLLGNEIQHQKLQIEAVATEKVERTVDDYEKVAVPQWDAPLVSIVVPVYNQFDYTYNCVKSVVKNNGTVSYEIIIADDCSTDLTTRIEEIITGLVVVVNPENLRFLRNCNNAAKVARGKYILFLNNDTQVQENWLEPLVELIERDETIGLVGSKLIYPDGRLQEAGGIFWRDGSAWNYGNRSDPDLPEYNYVKEVDYISGASIMLPLALWKRIGGFDERFAPAYCEDSDLAFTVRKLGYKVMYQPLSVVVHFEGVSNGTDITKGQKAYQVVNGEKFYEKWKEVLEQDHFDNGTNVFVARDRSRYKKTIVVIDHYIPTFDKDAGSRTVYQYLKLLTEMGYNVKLLPDNFYHDLAYARVYEQMGIEILYGPYYASHWKQWLKENSAYIRHVFFNRPHISIKYIDFVKENLNAKITYYGHDLHYIREMREYEVTGDIKLKHSAERWEKDEFVIMGKADTVFTLSISEKELINRRLGENKACISPIFYYKDIKRHFPDMKNREGLMFVGGFNHRPNKDGVLWFTEKILGTVRKAIPGCRFYIVGSNPPPEIQAIADEHTIVTGFVSDEELENYYHRARIVVIPLRYGAGVKGKTIEAMYHEIPVVSTSIGTEGLEDIEHCIPSTDDADAFAQRIIELYQKPDEQMAKVCDSYMQYISKHYSYESARALFENVFD